MNLKINNLDKSEIDKIVHLYKQKKFDDALVLSNKLLKKEKNIPFLFNLNGLINLSLENWENSVQVFQQAIDCDDKFVEAYNNIGIAYSHLGKELSLIHISEPTRLGMISYAVFCLKKKIE